MSTLESDGWGLFHAFSGVHASVCEFVRRGIDRCILTEHTRDERSFRYARLGTIPGPTPSEDLVQCATEEDAELIVIGLRRRSPVGKFLLGSNAQEILLDAKCPVLAVKAAY